MGSKPPKAPDPYATAAAQRGENIWTSQFNTIGQNANQYTPYGNVVSTPGAQIPIYDQHGNIQGYGTQWNQNTTLSPGEQAVFDEEQRARLGFGKLANQQMGMAKDVLGRPIDTSKLPAWQQYEKAPTLAQANYENTDRAAIEKAMMDSFYRGVNPQYERENVELAARGMGAPGSEVYYDVERGRGDVAGEATRNAYLASGAESREAAGEARAKAEAGNKVTQQGWLNKNTGVDQNNTLRGAMFGEDTNVRNQILNELSVLAGNAPVTVPQGQAFQGSAINPFDFNSAFQNKYSQDMAAYQNKQSGLFGIGKALLGMIPFGNMFGAGAGALGNI